MKNLFIIYALCVTLALGKDKTQFSYVSGRSGDIMLQSTQYSDNSVMYLVNNDAQMDSIKDQSVADLISHLTGGPIINSETSRDSFPESSLFNKNTANVLFVIDSIDSETLAQLDGIKMIKSGKPLKIESTSYPQDNIAFLATVSTGASTADHGIAGASWPTRTGQIQAFKVGALPLVQNLADSFSQTFEGKSLLFSSSSNFQMTSAFGVNQFVHQPSNNEVGLYFNVVTRSYESVYNTDLNIDALLVSAVNNTVAIAKSPLPLPGPQDSMTFDELYSEYTINLVSKKLEVTLPATDLTTLLVEVMSIRNLNSLLNNDAKFNSMATDIYPDLYTFSFGFLKGFERKYGKQSDEYKVVLYILDECINAAIESFSETYSKKVSVEIILQGKTAVQQLAENYEIKSQVYGMVKQSVRREIFDNNFPSVYLLPNADREIPCDAVQMINSVYSYCATELEAGLYDDQFYTHDWPNYYNQTNVTAETGKDAAIFQISLWAPIFLGLALLATIIAFCTMDVGADSMIYRSTLNLQHPHSN